MRHSTSSERSQSDLRRTCALQASTVVLGLAFACNKPVPDENVRALALEVATNAGPGWGGGATSNATSPRASHSPSSAESDSGAGSQGSDAGVTAPSDGEDASVPNQPDPGDTSAAEASSHATSGKPVNSHPAATDVTPGATHSPNPATTDLPDTQAPMSSNSPAASVAATAVGTEPSIQIPNPMTSTETPSAYHLPFTKANLLEAITECTLATYREFEDTAHELELVSSEFAASPDQDHVQVAREAWVNAIASWQRAEPFRFGPAARASEPGGLDLRDQIYAFPLGNACKVDQQIVDQTYESNDFSTSLSSARGLGTLEYLLFNESAGNSCYAAFAINADGSWAALGDQVWTRRADYAARTAEDVSYLAHTLVEAWEGNAGNFRDQLANAGSGSDTFSSTQQAFNAVSDGMFYIEKEVKDLKLGWPLGLVPDCINAPDACPNDVESRYARRSLDHIRQNLIGFRRLFEGCGANYSGLGYDDWMRSIGADDLATRMRTALIEAQAKVEELDPSLEQLLASDIARARELHTALKALTDLLKTEFVTVLNLELPKGAEGDND